MKAAIVLFPGSNCERDCHYAITNGLGEKAEVVFHKEARLPSGADLVILPGGFAHGDYLRCGAIAQFSPIMGAVRAFAREGGLVWGICNGFQVLTECGLLPGALLRNRTLSYVCADTLLRVERCDTPFTHGLAPHDRLTIPIGHGEGSYFIDAEGLARLRDKGQIVFRYVDGRSEPTDAGNPNGSVDNIAGIVNEAGNVCGMMPHPDRCADPLLCQGREADGRKLFLAVRTFLSERAVAAR